MIYICVGDFMVIVFDYRLSYLGLSFSLDYCYLFCFWKRYIIFNEFTYIVFFYRNNVE